MRLTRYRFGDFELDPASRELWRGGERIPLPLKSLECLAYLIAHRERAVGRDELASNVWKRADVSDALIAQTMRRARKALDDAGNRQALVRTVVGVGYQWVAPVDEVEATGAGPEARAQDASSAAAPVAAPSRLRARWPLATAATALLAVVAGAAWWWSQPAGRESAEAPAGTSDDLVMILPVAVEPGGKELDWMRLGAMEYAANRLRAGKLKVAPAGQAPYPGAELEDRWMSGAARSSDDSSLRQMLEDSTADWLLVPRVLQDGGDWRVELRAFDRRSDLSVEARDSTPLGAMAMATDAWLQRIGRAPPDLAAPDPFTERLQRVDVELATGLLEEARGQILQAPAAERGDPRLQVREGQLEYSAGRIDRAQALFAGALAAAGGTDVATRAKALMGLGAVALREQRFDEAEDRYTEALAALREPGAGMEDPDLLGDAYYGRGATRAKRNDMEGAVADMGLARVAMRQNGELVPAAMVGSHIGRIESARGQWSQAIQEFDRSIDVLGRYQVDDPLAATLASKADAQLAMAQGAAALATIEQGPVRAATDPAVARQVDTTRARVMLANGRLDDAEAVLRGLSRHPDGDADGVVAGLAMALALSRGDRTQAARLAARPRPPAAAVDDRVVVIAVQAAGNAADARAWRALIASPPPAGVVRRGISPLLATAIVERRFGDREAALATAIEATAQAYRDGSQDERIRAGVVHALLLEEDGRRQAAGTVLGELDAFAATDYRVAWLGWSIHREDGNAALVARMRAQAEALCGQRSLAYEPVL